MNLRALEKRVGELEERIAPSRTFIVGKDLEDCRAQVTELRAAGKLGAAENVCLIGTGVGRSRIENGAH